MGVLLVFVREKKETKYYLNADINMIADTYGFMIMQPPIELNHEQNSITFYLEHENFGSSMQVLREQKAWNQTYLSEKTGLTSQYISQMEHNKKTPKDTTLLKILEVMFCDQTHNYIEEPYSKTQAYSNSMVGMSPEERQEKMDGDMLLAIQELHLNLKSIVDTNDIYLLSLANETLSSYRAFYNCATAKDTATAANLITTVTNKVSTGLKKVLEEKK